MDFSPIEGAFYGNIIFKPMSKEDIEKAMKAHEIFKEVGYYPERYRENLKTALETSLHCNIESVILEQIA